MKKYKNKIIKVIIVIIVTALLEIFLFNFRYWELKMSGIDQETINIEKEYVKTDAYENHMYTKTIEIPTNSIIKGIKLNISTESKENIIISTGFVDNSAKYTEKNLRDTIYNVDFDKSEYIVLGSMQECQEIHITMRSSDVANLDSIIINTWYFKFNVIRFLIIILISCIFIYSKEINKWFEKDKDMQKAVYILIIGIVSIVYIGYAIKYTDYLEQYKYLTNAIREDPYQLLTQSLVNGSVEIQFDEESKQELLNLENYQDYTERANSGVKYLFDMAFYDGNYYCYYGITPVLTVLLPIALIFNIYLKSNIICIIYSIMSMILLQKIYKKILDKYDIKLKFSTEILGFLALFLSTGLFVLMGSANFYQAADLCGIAWGLFIIYLILLLDNNTKIKLKLFFIGLFFGMMVCSRPIYVLYIVPIIICVFKYIVYNKKIDIKRLIVFTLPIIIIAMAQMYYNYIRFDNAFEFGQFYNLTINNTKDQKMDLGRAIEGIIAYIFTPPSFKMVFPFIELSDPTVANGNIIYGEEMLGLIWFVYFCIFLYSNKIIKYSESKKLKWISISLLILAIVMFSVNTCLAGMNQRYTIDIQPVLAIIACIMWCVFVKNTQENHFFEFIIKVSVILTMLFVIPKLNYDIIENFSDEYSEIGKAQYYIEKMIYFYK